MEKENIFKKGDILKPNGLVKKSRGHKLENLTKLKVVKYYKPWTHDRWNDNRDPVVECQIIEKSKNSDGYPRIGRTIALNAKSLKLAEAFQDNFEIY